MVGTEMTAEMTADNRKMNADEKMEAEMARPQGSTADRPKLKADRLRPNLKAGTAKSTSTKCASTKKMAAKKMAAKKRTMATLTTATARGGKTCKDDQCYNNECRDCGGQKGTPALSDSTDCDFCKNDCYKNCCQPALVGNDGNKCPLLITWDKCNSLYR
eukprot:g6617.t1